MNNGEMKAWEKFKNVCKECVFHESGDTSVGLQAGCGHESLYDDNGIIDEVNDQIIDYMSSGECPLKEEKK